MKSKTKEADADQALSLKALLDHQEEVIKAEQELQRLKDIQSQHQAQIDRAERIDAELGQMHVQMQDLQGDIAAGEDKKAELAELEERYSKASNALSDEAFDNADYAVAGLDRKIERQKALVQEMKARRPVLMRAMLMDRAEAMGAEYAEAALKTIHLYRRLSALNYILMANGRALPLMTNAQLEVPLFELDSVRPYAEFHYKGHMYRGAKMRSDLLPFEKAELEKLAELGVDVTPDGA